MGCRKTFKIRRNFWQLSTLIANISGTDTQIKNRKSSLSKPLLRWAKKVGELWSTNKKVIDVYIDPPKWTFFGRLYFGPYGVMCLQIFIRARDCTRLANSHPNWDDGGPPKNDDEKLKFGFKFSVCAPITSGLVWIFSPNFFRPRDELWSTSEKVIARILIHPNCSYTVSWRKSIRHVVIHQLLLLLLRNWLSTRTCGAGWPHVGLCHALLICYWNFLLLRYHINLNCSVSEIRLLKGPKTPSRSFNALGPLSGHLCRISGWTWYVQKL